MFHFSAYVQYVFWQNASFCRQWSRYSSVTPTSLLEWRWSILARECYTLTGSPHSPGAPPPLPFPLCRPTRCITKHNGDVFGELSVNQGLTRARQAANGLPLNFKWFTQEEWLTGQVGGDACEHSSALISKFCKRTRSASRSALQTQENRQLRRRKGIN